ncbi:MAG: uracil-DNA glycosylase [Methylophilaceae bacterium]|nr:uracil-DNA glycosylase [Methylophilaceae bacterium]
MRLGREQVLRELELLPMWKLKQAALQTKAVPQVAAEPASVAEALPEASALPSIMEPSSEDRNASIAQMDWQALQSCVSHCEACVLSQTRTQTVFGVGNPNAEWMFIGEAPGMEEDQQGVPFVGQAGHLLDNMLLAMALQRGQNVYISNILKCRPPENCDPHRGEITQCAPYLQRQVALIKPRLIIALGRVAAQSLLNTQENVADLRGKQHVYQDVPVIVTYHPAYLLRNLPDKAKAWDDLCYANSVMQGLKSGVSS